MMTTAGRESLAEAIDDGETRIPRSLVLWSVRYVLRDSENSHAVYAADGSRGVSLCIEPDMSVVKGPFIAYGHTLSERLGVTLTPHVMNDGGKWFEAPLRDVPYQDVSEEVHWLHQEVRALLSDLSIAYVWDEEPLIEIGTGNEETLLQFRRRLGIPKGRIQMNPIGPLGSDQWKWRIRESDLTRIGELRR